LKLLKEKTKLGLDWTQFLKEARREPVGFTQVMASRTSTFFTVSLQCEYVGVIALPPQTRKDPRFL
jgi:hypothetical protein